MKKCELCKNFARMYCESDNASLCYECDQKVHSANFLVAKHSRTLLCHKCQSPTPWNATGLNLGRTASVCVSCINEGSSQRRGLTELEFSHRENDVVEENCVVRDDEDEDDDTEYSDEDDEDEDTENQVVPWSIMESTTPANDSSSSDEFSSDDFRSGNKRRRSDDFIDSEDDAICFTRSNSKARIENDAPISVRSFRPF